MSAHTPKAGYSLPQLWEPGYCEGGGFGYMQKSESDSSDHWPEEDYVRLDDFLAERAERAELVGLLEEIASDDCTPEFQCKRIRTALREVYGEGGS